MKKYKLNKKKIAKNMFYLLAFIADITIFAMLIIKIALKMGVIIL